MEQNQFYVGDVVQEIGDNNLHMVVISNIPGGGKNEDYLQTNQFVCEWIENGITNSKTLHGDELILVKR